MLSPYALISVDEFKERIPMQGASRDSSIESIINQVSDEIEDFLDREIVTRTTADVATRITEYHSFTVDGVAVRTDVLRTLEWPIISVITVHEDTALPKTYGAGSLLTVSTDYIVQSERGSIRRVSSSARQWATGPRAVRVVYSAGYAATANVPQRIKGVALRYAALIWAEVKGQNFGVSGQTDGLGNFTRFSTAQLDKSMQDALSGDRRLVVWQSGERDV